MKRLRALLDQRSQASILTESAVQLLRLQRTDMSTSIARISAVSRYQKELLSFNLQVPNVLPDRTISMQSWPHFADLQLADPNLHRPSKIAILLGADILPTLLLNGVKKGPHGSPMA